MASTSEVNIDTPNPVIVTSGLVTVESGLGVLVQSGLWTMGIALADVSGEWVETHILSGEVTLPSTQIVKISGETIEIVSGQTVQLPATQVVKTSGEAGYTPADGFTGGMVIIGAISGGIALLSGEVQSLAVNTPSNNSGDIYMGFTSYRPYSGYGFLLEPGAGVTVDITDPAATFYFAEMSGDLVSYMGTI